MIGKKILHYEIIEKLGEGGMGIVYLAKDTKLRRQVAIKFLPKHIAGNNDERKRFEIEAQAAASLNHPNISTIHAIEHDGDNVFIVMEYISGRELNDLTNPSDLSRHKLDLGTVFVIIKQIASGLQTANEKGIVHRDIKSSNIMLTDADQVKIMDFGLAKVGGTADPSEEYSTLGTAAYMSPEQIRGDAVDCRTDIWSFGIVLYELLTNTLPFKGDYDQAVFYAILNEKVPSLDRHRTDLPESLIQLVNQCLEKNAEDRPETFLDILDQLNKIETELRPQDTAVHSLPELIRQPKIYIPALIISIVIFILSVWWINRMHKIEWARTEMMPKIVQIADRIPWTGEGPLAWQAFSLAASADEYLSDDPAWKTLTESFTNKLFIHTSPDKAMVYARPYGESDNSWQLIGQSPLDSIRLPKGFSQIKIEKEGYATVRDVIWNVPYIPDTFFYPLIQENQIPNGMILLPDSGNWHAISGAPASLHMPGLEQIEGGPIGDFLIDRYEISNEEYKRFIDAAGYQKEEYWKYPFKDKDTALTWPEAMKKFVDKTGRPGPSTWEVGDYPNGEGDYPVTGVSWFEAAAYAEYAGKSLPTIFHWDRAAFTWASPEIVPRSNLINGKRSISRTETSSMSRFGTYDLAGNVREWCYNAGSRGGRFILGGGWNDPAYAFNDAFTQSPFDRSETNGFRCIRYLPSHPIQEKLNRIIDLPFRDFLNEPPIDEQTFSFYLKQFEYDNIQLRASVIDVQETEDWIRQKINFTAAYGNEEMLAYLFLPKGYKPPYQTVVYFPGSGSIFTRSSANIRPADFFLKSGRAFLYPVYKSTYERGDGLISDYPDQTNNWKDHIIMWVKDFRRAVDYLESRADIDPKKLAYYGSSWGGAMGAIIPAVENRIKVSILRVAGLNFQWALPEVDQIHYLPRNKAPVLMLNGKYDFFFPYETSQLPFYKLHGAVREDKKMFVYEGGHSVPGAELAKESLNWLDRYFGQALK